MTSNRVYDRFLATLPNNPTLSASFAMEFNFGDENRDLKRWFIELEGSHVTNTSDRADPFTVAALKLVSVDIDAGDHDRALTAFDCDSDELERIASATMDLWEQNTRLIIVESVEVDERFRGFGLGPMHLIDSLVALGANQMPSLVMLEAGCLDWESLTPLQYRMGVQAACSAWERAGFKQVESAAHGRFYTLHGSDISVEGAEARAMEHSSALNRDEIASLVFPTR